jgi:hypothetical protein
MAPYPNRFTVRDPSVYVPALLISIMGLSYISVL